MPSRGNDYVPPFAAAGGEINSMKRFEEMQRRAGAGYPAPTPNQPLPPPHQTPIVQGLINAFKSLYSAPPAPAPNAPQESVDSLINGMKEVNARARSVLR